ncbi:SusC/RagA family TonB-linked outer membrane protein [Marinifilum sp.]|uniref:SusC/RagA family TonB-linked outer membrane protein n=1 Tax=Marinifilum sp. TaxID=2033137 RepID=UPI003BAD3E1A
MKKNFLVWLLTLFSVVVGSAQTINSDSGNFIVSGTVTDEKGDPIPGANVIVKESFQGTITDINGKYTLNVPTDKNELVYSFIGLLSQTIEINGRSLIDVQLQPDIENLEEVVVVGYGTQKKISVTGSVSVVKEEALQSTPSTTLATALTGRMPGVVVVQNSGEAGAQSARIRIRGAEGNPLVLVDGVERSFEDLDPDEIKNISVLKDASATAVYGIRGADGVIIVTTKRGNFGKPKIKFSANFGLVQAADLPEMLNSYEYAMLKNEGTLNDEGENASLPYTEEDLRLYQTGEDPIFHPDHRWYDEMTNDFGYRQKYGVNISGGASKIKYFVSLGYNKERDIFKDFNVGYDDESYYNRYNVRSNLDIDLTPTSVLSVDIGGQFAKRHKPNTDLSGSYGIAYSAFRTPPDAFAGLVDGRLVQLDRTIDYNTPLEMLFDNGYKETSTNKVQLTAKFKQKLDFITKGLAFNAAISYDHGYSSTLTASKNVPVYYPERDDATGDITYMRDGAESRLGNSRGADTQSKLIKFKSALNYSREFGDGHHISGVGVFTTNERHYSGIGDYSYVPKKYVELAARVSYNYKHKYFLEGNFGYNGSENFAEDKRYGFFPAVSVGWVVSKEKFFPTNSILSFMKFKASYGEAGRDNFGSQRFFYTDVYTMELTGGYRFGIDPNGQGIGKESRLGATELTWETHYKQNYGIETKWFRDFLHVDFEYYKNRIEDNLITRNSVTELIGVKLPPVNAGKSEVKGYEIQASVQGKIGKVKYNLYGNYNFSENKRIYFDEVAQEYPWQVKTGKSRNVTTGFEWVGFYTQEEVDEIAAGNATPDNPASGYTGNLQAGDMKYRDLNGDGIINQIDEKVFENTSTPKTTFGFGGGLSYKGFSMNLHFQGVTDVTYNIQGRIKVPFFNGNGNGLTYVLDRWTPETAETAKFPRMSATGKAGDHNYRSSDFWFRDASYIRLKNAEIAYSFANKKLKNLGISKCKIYANGSNLYTWTDLKLVDPEAKNGDAVPIPPNKVFNFGVNVTF